MSVLTPAQKSLVDRVDRLTRERPATPIGTYDSVQIELEENECDAAHLLANCDMCLTWSCQMVFSNA